MSERLNAQIAEATEMMQAAGVPVADALRATQLALPGYAIDEDMLPVVTAGLARDWFGAPHPRTRDSIAQHLADRSGAFPWAGPVGNGLTLDQYRDAFRQQADTVITWAIRLGLPQKDAA